jgi:alpha-L-fucosidase
MKKIFLLLLLGFSAVAQQTANKLERVNWFQDLGFGMFIHWNVDVSLGLSLIHI